MAIYDLKANLDLKQNLNIYATCKQLDNLNLILSVYDNSVQTNLSNYTVRLKAMKADKVPLIQEHTGISISSNIVTIVADEQLTITSGKTLMELQFIDNSTGKKKATFNLVLNVVSSTLEIDRSISKATYTLLEELENKLDQASDFFENIDTATNINNELKDTINTANSKNNTLTETINNSNTTNDTLNNLNTVATQTKNDLENQNSQAVTNKTNLDSANSQAVLNYEALQQLGDATELAIKVEQNTTQLNENVNFGYEESLFSNSKDRFESILVNVKDFGAKGDDETDDTESIQKAINYCKTEGKTLYFPHGVYLISKSLILADVNNPVRNFTILGEYSAPTYNNYYMKSVIKAMDSFPENTTMIDLRYTFQTSIKMLGIYGKCGLVGTTGIELGTREDSDGTFSNHIITECNIYNHYDGIRASNSGISRISNNNIANCFHVGIALYKYCGDSDLENNYVNTNNVEYSGSDIYTGVGILMGNGCGNSNIHGGKIEWNAKGIVVYGAQGINIYGVNFDHNSHCHIYCEPTGDKGNNNGTLSIVANRFLSGGYIDSATSKHHIILKAQNYALRATISGNTFRKGGASAYDDNIGDNIGPVYSAIMISTSTGIADISICGNDMVNCASIASIVASGPNIVIHESGNSISVPIERYSGALIEKSYNGTRSRVYYGGSMPSMGNYKLGDKVINENPNELGSIGSKYIIYGWVCVVAGEPGTWTELRMMTGN